MFVSLPEFAFDVPAGLRISPAARHWRAMMLFGQQPWFLATFAGDPTEELARSTICFCWDSDLVAAARNNANGTLIELVCMLPPLCSGTGQWKGEQVTEILEGRDLDRAGEPSFAFRTVEGAILHGPFLQPVGPQLTQIASVTIIQASSGSRGA